MAQQEVLNGAQKPVVPVTFTALKPQLLVEAPKANDAITFYKAAFGAEEVSKTLNSKRKAEQEQALILSAELKIGGFTILIADNALNSSDEVKSVGAGFVLCLETEDVVGAVAKAVGAGAVADGEIVEGEVGGRVGRVKDPFGFVWVICSPAATETVDDVAA